jgi:uncharacterized protein YeaO (DUF488 family)
MEQVFIKRVYEQVNEEDGKRVLVDRLWPRGLAKEKAFIEDWMKDIAPSPGLRKWFCHKPELFEEFREKYEQELQFDPIHQEKVDQICDWAKRGRVTLVYAAKDMEFNHAVILRDWINKELKIK